MITDSGGDQPQAGNTVHDPGTNRPPTPWERNSLTLEGFDLEEQWPDHGNSSLVRAYRAGFQDATRFGDRITITGEVST
jgi:hypothetical protein